MSERRQARLVLETGAVFDGVVAGGPLSDACRGDVVFNTCMTGYQEVVTDPSYAGQIVVMTYPLIGNYGWRADTAESARVWCRGLVVHRLSDGVGHAAAESDVEAHLRAAGVAVLTGVDTRALTRHVRQFGTVRGVVVSADVAPDVARAQAQAVAALEAQDFVSEVSTPKPYTWDQDLDASLQREAVRQFPGTRIVVVDLGVKYNQLRALHSRGAEVIVVPHNAAVEDVLAHKPDGVLLSNGPGDPARLDGPVQLARDLMERRAPLLGICLGHQVIGRAAGATTARLHFGHHGGNHPVRDEQTGAVYITSHNHEFAVQSLPADSAFVVSERSLNDSSVEGLRHRELPVFSVQYHPEGAPGPQDRAGVFDDFLEMAQRRAAPVVVPNPELDITKPESVLVIGSGPVVIGQAAEFDYAGTQACRSLREEGVRVILVNSNPATIMTDDATADVVYIEPLRVDVLERIIASERPDAVLPTLGGQTALNLVTELAEAGVLETYGVAVLGSSLEAIAVAEDRERFKQMLQSIGQPTPPSRSVTSLTDALAVADDIGLPLCVRPAFTLGGTGGGLCETGAQLRDCVTAGISASPIGQVLVEQSLHGWREVEYEVMRDRAGTCITVCTMENLDPMGVHTGDSVVVAPTQTLTDREHQQLRSAALRIIDELGIVGGCNVQFALAPDSADYFVIEVNPRVSRSSALASKATGYPIARVAAKLAIGKRLDEITNAVTGKTTAAFEPTLDYCVIKMPRFAFDKFPGADRRLTTQMKSTGEAMAIGRTFEAAFSKALRSLEQTQPAPAALREATLVDVANDMRFFAIMQALRDGETAVAVSGRSGVGLWFVERIAAIVACEERLRWNGLSDELVRTAKQMGISDARIAALCQVPAAEVARRREAAGIRPVFKSVDTCAAEFDAATPYYYSAYDVEDETAASGDAEKPVVVVGSGPIRIGQGIEFDYCSVQAAQALRADGIPAVMINSNPETVSTDFDCSTRLYFEPLDAEAVAAVAHAEGARGAGLQFGGQTAINLAHELDERGIAVLGSSVHTIDQAEDRGAFEELMRRLDVPQPHGGAATNAQEAVTIAAQIGYPVLVRPSFVLGGRAMEVVHSEAALQRYLLGVAAETWQRGPLLVDRYLVGVEVDVDAVSDGDTVVIPGLMEHIERAGVHSGDSMAAYPPQHISEDVIDQIVDTTVRSARALDVRGLCNIQFVIFGGRAHVIEVNPRASRTVPFISKVTGVPMAELATAVMTGTTLKSLGFASGLLPAGAGVVAVKAPAFSTTKLTAVDSALSPEMKSTGEVMGIDTSLGAAVEKAFAASVGAIPLSGGVLCSVADADKPELIALAHRLRSAGFSIYATAGTAAALAQAGVQVLTVGKIGHSRPTVVDIIDEGRVQLVINSVSHFDADKLDAAAGTTLHDGYRIRQAAQARAITCCTSLDTAAALVDTIERRRQGRGFAVAPLAAYRQGLHARPVATLDQSAQETATSATDISGTRHNAADTSKQTWARR